jgi:hypothetical protein
MEPEQERVSRILKQQLKDAMERRRLASLAFQEVTLAPSGLPHPDGTQRVMNASKAYSAALRNVTEAVKRRSAYIVTGITPDDLTREWT